ncbi:MAG TPA: MFS transporter [Chloroflexota bacterium]|nr:MFS transporter [Chloroflexota bacterium]
MTSQRESTRAQTRLGREFIKLWAASAISNLGDGVWLVAAPLLAITLTHDPALVAGLAFTQRLPWLIFPLISGALADRLDRRKAMVAVTIFRSALIGILGLSVLTGLVTLPLLYVIFFLMTTAETLFDTSSAALLPIVVPSGQLTKANARLSGTMSVTNQFIGLPLGGLLFSKAAAIPFTLGAGSLAIAAGILTTLRGSFRPGRAGGSPPANLRTEIGDGVRWLWAHRLLRTTAVTLGILNLVLVAQVSIMVLYAEERLGVGPAGYGVLLTAYGLGGMAGGLVAERVIAVIGDGTYLRLAVIIEALIPAVIVLTTSPYVVGIALFLFGVHAIVWGAVLVSLRQELTPDSLRGRVHSAYGLIENGTAAPGALLGGFLAVHFGLTSPFWFSTVVALILLPFVWPAYSDEEVARARHEAAGGADGSPRGLHPNGKSDNPERLCQ